MCMTLTLLSTFKSIIRRGVASTVIGGRCEWPERVLVGTAGELFSILCNFYLRYLSLASAKQGDMWLSEATVDHGHMIRPGDER